MVMEVETIGRWKAFREITHLYYLKTLLMRRKEFMQSRYAKPEEWWDSFRLWTTHAVETIECRVESDIDEKLERKAHQGA